jgi:hypothetical protein
MNFPNSIYNVSTISYVIFCFRLSPNFHQYFLQKHWKHSKSSGPKARKSCTPARKFQIWVFYFSQIFQKQMQKNAYYYILILSHGNLLDFKCYFLDFLRISLVCIQKGEFYYLLFNSKIPLLFRMFIIIFKMIKSCRVK